MAKDKTAKLDWLDHLPEAGDITRRTAAKERAMLARRAELLREVTTIDAALETLRKDALRLAKSQWKPEEIQRAKQSAGAAS